jgi:hypothetical protein
MKYLKILAVPLVLGLIFIGCTSRVVESELGETTEIKYGNSVYIAEEGLSIEFSGDVFDSRCPLNAYCFWEGQAVVQFKIQKMDSIAVVTDAILGSSEEVSKPAYYNGYKISILSLSPYPVDPEPQIPNDIRVATIRVDKIDPDDTCRQKIDPVHFSNVPPSDLMVDDFGLTELTLSADTLTVGVLYSGGCLTHDFYLYMDPPAFMESYPVQANLYIRHYDYDDPCDALIIAYPKFNIRPIAELYQAQYGQLDNIILNVYDYTLQSYLSIVYSPE